MNVKRIKKYVEVTAAFDANGSLRPLFIKWDDGREFHIDKIKDIRRTNSVAVSGKGIRYTVLIWGKVCYLFYEENYKWFVEEKVTQNTNKTK